MGTFIRRLIVAMIVGVLVDIFPLLWPLALVFILYQIFVPWPEPAPRDHPRRSFRAYLAELEASMPEPEGMPARDDKPATIGVSTRRT